MDPDILLVVGIIVAGLSIPSMMSAIADRRAPRASAITVLIAGGLIIWAIRSKPGGYTISDIPDAFIRVVAQMM